MRNWLFLLVLVLIGIFQVTFLEFFKLFGLKPDLLLIGMVVANLFFSRRSWAILFSIFAGAFKDIFTTGAFGINIVLFSLWSFLIARLSKKIALDTDFMRLALVFLVCLLHNIITGLIFANQGRGIIWGMFLRIVTIGSLYTTLVSALLFRLTRVVFKID